MVGLLTTVTESFGRVSMHGVREELLDAQAKAAGLALTKVRIPFPCPNEVYERSMAERLAAARDDGVTHLAFGDLFLREVREYRELQLAKLGLGALFPLWGAPTPALAATMLREGLAARVVCLDPRRLERRFAGRSFDAGFLSELPPDVDPCGENGEFHTFVTDGPMFTHPVPVRSGEVVERDGFVFADLLPGGGRGSPPA